MIRAVIIAATVAILAVMLRDQPAPVQESARYCFVSDPFDPRDFALCSELKYKVWI